MTYIPAHGNAACLALARGTKLRQWVDRDPSGRRDITYLVDLGQQRVAVDWGYWPAAYVVEDPAEFTADMDELVQRQCLYNSGCLLAGRPMLASEDGRTFTQQET